MLLLHIPKTAGTSLLLMLQNAFGDNKVRRIHQIDEHIAEALELIVETELSRISCLAGHFPIHLFDSSLHRFQPFTVLREPVARVLSLYRFLHGSDPQELRRVGLRPNFALDELLSSQHPELFGQVNNGMVRMLCGDRRFGDPHDPAFWDTDDCLDALRGAVANLEQIDFGLTEDMATSIALAQIRWGVPYQLREYRENATSRDATNIDVAQIHRITCLNAMDLAFYHRAKAMFRERTRLLPKKPVAEGWNELSVFKPKINETIGVGDIPGRQGFHEFESINLAWLKADQTAEIHMYTSEDVVRLNLYLYCIIPDYPGADIAVSVNGQPVVHKFRFVSGNWGSLETDYFEPVTGLNQIAIQAPLFIPLIQLNPATQDNRRLGIALAHMRLEP